MKKLYLIIILLLVGEDGTIKGSFKPNMKVENSNIAIWSFTVSGEGKLYLKVSTSKTEVAAGGRMNYYSIFESINTGLTAESILAIAVPTVAGSEVQIQVSAHASDGSDYVLSPSEYKPTVISTKEVGEYSATITACGFSTTLHYSVIEKELNKHKICIKKRTSREVLFILKFTWFSVF